MKHLMKYLKKLLFWILILAAVGVIGVLVYITYLDINAGDAKEYLIEKYSLKKSQFYATKYTEYVYDDITDCNSLWFKECTSNKDLKYEYVFKTKDGEKITVTEDVNGNYNDDYRTDNSDDGKENPEDRKDIPSDIVEEYEVTYPEAN